MKSKNRFFKLDRYDENSMFEVCLYSGHANEDSKCRLVLSAFGWYLTFFLPRIIRPYKYWVDLSKADWSDLDGYWKEDERAFGFYLFKNHFNILYGRQSTEGDLSKSWGFFLPWNEWRHVRLSLYDKDGQHFWTQSRDDDKQGSYFQDGSYDQQTEAKKQCSKRLFEFQDYDGERITVTTMIQEREWLRGVKAFRWLSRFFYPKIRRSLNLEFHKEVGPRKGSWKGGTIGHSIEMLPGELHEAAFRRYCEKNNMTFIREIV
jgi:hypothetical protein